MSAVIEKQILTTAEVAEFLGVSEKEVRRLEDEKHLKRLAGFRKPMKFSRVEVQRFLKGGVR